MILKASQPHTESHQTNPLKHKAKDASLILLPIQPYIHRNLGRIHKFYVKGVGIKDDQIIFEKKPPFNTTFSFISWMCAHYNI